jgi:hypothetical protein
MGRASPAVHRTVNVVIAVRMRLLTAKRPMAP